jgi:hypothetical protein
MKKFLLLVCLAVASLTVFPGCPTVPAARVVEYQTLKTIGLSAKATVDGAALLLKQGAITVPQWQGIAACYDTKFQPAYALAVAAAQSDLSTAASPDLIVLAGQLASLIASYTHH